MIVGLLHSHSGLAYIVFLAALLNLFFALASGSLGKNSVVLLTWTHRLLIWCGRLNLLVGVVYWAMSGFMNIPLIQQWWIFVSVLLWGPIEVMAKRFVVPELELLQAGASKSKKLTIGVVVQLLCMICIFGLMSMPH
jgi:hypothetical protein